MPFLRAALPPSREDSLQFQRASREHGVGTSWEPRGLNPWELSFGLRIAEILQSDTVTCFHGPKSVLILFAYF